MLNQPSEVSSRHKVVRNSPDEEQHLKEVGCHDEGQRLGRRTAGQSVTHLGPGGHQEQAEKQATCKGEETCTEKKRFRIKL